MKNKNINQYIVKGTMKYEKKLEEIENFFKKSKNETIKSISNKLFENK